MQAHLDIILIFYLSWKSTAFSAYVPKISYDRIKYKATGDTYRSDIFTWESRCWTGVERKIWDEKMSKNSTWKLIYQHLCLCYLKNSSIFLLHQNVFVSLHIFTIFLKQKEKKVFFHSWMTLVSLSCHLFDIETITKCFCFTQFWLFGSETKTCFCFVALVFWPCWHSILLFIVLKSIATAICYCIQLSTVLTPICFMMFKRK